MSESNDLESQAIEEEIEGFTYKLVPLPFGRGRRALMRLVRVMSPILSATFRDGEQLDKLRMISRALEVLPQSLSDDDVTFFAKEFGDCSSYLDGSKWVPLLPAKQEQHFAARYLAFLRWLSASIKLNFGNFFSGVMSGSVGLNLVAPGTTETLTESK